jgi:hypothetical protein
VSLGVPGPDPDRQPARLRRLRRASTYSRSAALIFAGQSWPYCRNQAHQVLVDLHPEMLEVGRDDKLRSLEPLLAADRRGVGVVADRRLDLHVGQLVDPLPVGLPFWQALKTVSDDTFVFRHDQLSSPR